jgi:hypothetical protein
MMLIAMLIAAVTTSGLGLRPAAAQPQPTDDPERVRQLAERLLATGSSGFGWGVDLVASGPRPTARLLPGRLPDGLPLTVPVPPGGQIVGSVARTMGGQLASAEILIDAPGTTAELRPIYEAAFSNQGWTAPKDFPSGGFQQIAPLLSYARCVGDDYQGMAIITLGQLDAGRIEVRLHLYLPALARTSGPVGAPAGGPCATFSSSRASIGIPNYRRDLLPTLTAPVGSRLQSTGGAMGSDYATDEALAETDRSAGQLEAHFATQLEQAGWVKVDSGDAGAVAYSSWSLPHEPEWFGMLTVAQTPVENRYALTVRVETPGSGAGAIPSFRGTFPAQPGLPVGVPAPAPGVAPGVLIPMNPDLTPQEMAECLANNPDPAVCMAAPDR